MSIWTPRASRLVSGQSSPDIFIGTNDRCTCSRQGLPADRLAYGCLRCQPPTRYADLPDKLRSLIPIHDLPVLWTHPVLCPEHHLPLIPRCGECGSTIDQYGATPPVGIWGLSAAGKSVYCAALYLEIERRLHEWTGIRKRFVSDPADLQVVVRALEDRGILPGKTQWDGQRSLVMVLSGAGWPSRKLTLTDCAGELYTGLFPSGDDGHGDVRREIILRTRSAILLATPEACVGLGATARRDLFPAIQRTIDVLGEGGLLAQFGRADMERLVGRVEDALARHQYPIQGGRSFVDLGTALASLVGRPPDEALVTRLDEELSKVAARTGPPTLAHQIDSLIAFLSGWGYPRVAGKLALRLAITVAKSDLLNGACGRYDDALAGLGPANTRPEWERALQRVSANSKATMLAHGETDVVMNAEMNFADVGFFFVSSLGRDTETFVQDNPDARRPRVHGSHEVYAGTPASAPADGSAARTAWRLGKRLRPGREGTRQPRPQHVLLPLLWLLAREPR